MKIKEWEQQISKKYSFEKITDILMLKKYLTHQDSYNFNFCAEEITETDISNEDYYASYVFNENEIAGRNVKSIDNSGWNTTIIFLASKDKINISNYFIHESNGLTREEMDKFLQNTISTDVGRIL